MKLSDIITPEKFRALASFVSDADEKFGLEGTEVQDDLHKFANALEEMEAKNISSNPVLADSLPIEQYPDNEADGIVFCGKCGAKK